jgi:alcohol dehydrogenase class IV
MPTFNSPNIIFGEDSLDQIETIQGSKCFIVTDEGLVKLGMINILTEKLKKFNKEWKIFDKVEPDPHETTILAALEECKTFEPDLIIGFGGGSSLDAAKAVWFLYEHDGFGIDELNPFEQLHMGVKAKCIAIPTTSGTGAETTWAVIVTRIDENGNHSKLEQAHKDVVPTYAIVDPIFTMKLPPKLTAATGFDALSHACEGLVAEWRNDIAEGCCIHALDIIKDYLVKAYKDGSDKQAREKMANAATLAGLGFGNSQVIMGHSMGHALGAVFHVTHGNTVGLMLPYVLEFSIKNPNNATSKAILAKAARRLLLASKEDNDEKASMALLTWIKQIQKEVNLPTKLEELGIQKEKLEENMDRLVELTNESASVTMSPREPLDADIRKIFLYAFEGKSIDW